jgi:CRISPR-associated protein Csd2
MSVLENKIDFKVFVQVIDANPNGDPLNGNRPRTSYTGHGEMSAECIKRKIRNRMQDMNQNIFVQSADRCDDGFGSLSERAEATLKGCKTKEEYAQTACATWTDVRSFGQVFAFKKKGEDGVSVGVRGPVSVHMAKSISPVDINTIQITKSVNGEPAEKKSSDTMGSRHMVDYGLYEIKGSINVQLAEKTGFSESDAELIKECLRTLFINDASAARPDGSMEVIRVYWWKHHCKDGQYSAAKVHGSVKAVLKDSVRIPSSFEDYEIIETPLENLAVEIIDGI